MFEFLPHPRGRTRGRAVLDEEDSMDGTEITESTGLQDTGESPRNLFAHACGDVRSCIRLELALPGSFMQRLLQMAISVKVKESPSPGERMDESFFLAPYVSTSGL